MSIGEERRIAIVLLSGVFIIGYEYRGRNTQSGCVEFSSLGMCIGEEIRKAVVLSFRHWVCVSGKKDAKRLS